jgi:hypothetical protein
MHRQDLTEVVSPDQVGVVPPGQRVHEQLSDPWRKEVAVKVAESVAQTLGVAESRVISDCVA